MKPIPDDVKDILAQLSGPHQVALRSYIATLRAEIKQFEEDLHASQDPDPHAHYHGHDKCTADHGHSNAEHADEHKVTNKDHDSHEHKHHYHDKHHDAHEHTHHEHKKEEAACSGNHEHEHHDHSMAEDHHDHDNEHKHHSCDHDHGHDHNDEMPAWKKAALDADPSAAPFGGTWNAESNVSATTNKMEE